MAEGLTFVASRLQEAEIARGKGDALRKLGKEELAREAFAGGVTSLDEALTVLRGAPWLGFPAVDESVDQSALSEMVEVLGSRGGLLQRIGALDQALASYEEGAILERRFAMGSTYNRLNVVKCRIRMGAPLASLLPDIGEIATTIDRGLAAHQATSDSAWAWADLADCRALLGELDQAETAYAAFIARSQTKSPKRALQVLTELHRSLEKAGDAGAARVGAAITTLQGRLDASGG